MVGVIKTNVQGTSFTLALYKHFTEFSCTFAISDALEIAPTCEFVRVKNLDLERSFTPLSGA